MEQGTHTYTLVHTTRLSLIKRQPWGARGKRGKRVADRYLSPLSDYSDLFRLCVSLMANGKQ